MDASFASVRLRTRRPGREWAWLCACVALLAALVAVPGIGGASSNAGRRRAPPAPRQEPRRDTRTGIDGLSTAARRQQAAGTQGTQINRPPLAVTSNGSPTPKGSGFSPYGHGGISFSAKQLAAAGIASPSDRYEGSRRTRGQRNRRRWIGIRREHPGRQRGRGRGQAGRRLGVERHAGIARGRLGLGSGRAHARVRQPQRQRSRPGAGAGKANASSGAGGSANSPPGGNGAGTAPGSTALRAGLVPVLGAGATGLPLQAGYAPSSAQQSDGGEGVSQTPNGGGIGGRSAQAGGGGRTSVSSSLGLIPPTFNSTSALDQGVLSSYFGSANQLTPGNW